MDDIQPTMARTVAWLRHAGFDTCDSGDGVANVEAGMECAIPEAHVFCRVAPELLVAEAGRLHALVAAAVPAVHVEATYSPDDGGSALLCLFGVRDDLLPRELPGAAPDPGRRPCCGTYGGEDPLARCGCGHLRCEHDGAGRCMRVVSWGPVKACGCTRFGKV